MGQQLLQQLGGELGGLQARQQMQGQGQELLLPVVVDHLGQHRFTLLLKPQLRRSAGFEGLALEAAAAEAVDRGDVGAVEFFQGQQQLAPQRIDRGCWLALGWRRAVRLGVAAQAAG